MGRVVKYGASLLLVHLILGCSPDTPQQAGAPHGDSPGSPKPVAPDADAKLVVAYGDSLFAGYNLPQGQGFAPALERALAARGMKTRVINAGVSGDTSAGGLERLAFTLDGLARKPDLVILGLGANDMLRGFRPEVTRANLDAMLAALKERGIPVMLTGMVAAPNMGADYAAAFNPIYADLARKYGVTLYPFFLEGVAGHRDRLLADGMHPNDQGIGIIIGHVAPIVQADLGAQAPPTGS